MWTFFLLFIVAAALAHAGAPPLPYDSFTTWAVVTETAITGTGPNATTKQLGSIGQVLNVDASAGVLCATQQQHLPPVHEYTTTVVLNYTAGLEQSRRVLPSGNAEHCSSDPIPQGVMPSGGGPLLAPSAALRRRMSYVNWTVIGKVNCSVWQYQSHSVPGLLSIITWTVSADGGVPQVYVNETLYLGQKRAIVLTTAYNGYHRLAGALPWQCRAVHQCGSGFCVARPEAPQAQLQAALSWVCSEINCGPINPGGAKYYPNTLEAHATYAFNTYYVAHPVAASCNFNGAAELVLCPTQCTRCRPKPTSTEAQLNAALGFLCSSRGIQDCSPIRPGGAHFHPNTTQAHAAWAMNVYYQAYKCVPSWDACDFGGAAEVAPCRP